MRGSRVMHRLVRSKGENKRAGGSDDVQEIYQEQVSFDTTSKRMSKVMMNLGRRGMRAGERALGEEEDQQSVSVSRGVRFMIQI